MVTKTYCDVCGEWGMMWIRESIRRGSKIDDSMKIDLCESCLRDIKSFMKARKRSYKTGGKK